MSDRLLHSGFISSIKYDNLTPWYTTVEDNEIINFVDENGKLIKERETTTEYDNNIIYPTYPIYQSPTSNPDTTWYSCDCNDCKGD